MLLLPLKTSVSSINYVLSGSLPSKFKEEICYHGKFGDECYSQQVIYLFYPLKPKSFILQTHHWSQYEEFHYRFF